MFVGGTICVLNIVKRYERTRYIWYVIHTLNWKMVSALVIDPKVLESSLSQWYIFITSQEFLSVRMYHKILALRWVY